MTAERWTKEANDKAIELINKGCSPFQISRLLFASKLRKTDNVGGTQDHCRALTLKGLAKAPTVKERMEMLAKQRRNQKPYSPPRVLAEKFEPTPKVPDSLVPTNHHIRDYMCTGCFDALPPELKKLINGEAETGKATEMLSGLIEQAREVRRYLTGEPHAHNLILNAVGLGELNAWVSPGMFDIITRLVSYDQETTRRKGDR